MNSKVVDRQDHSRSRYVWGNKKVNEIRKVQLSWGDSPIYYIDIKNDTICLYRRINGSRDGWMNFPENYFDEKEKPLVVEKKKKLFQFLETIDFTKWVTNERTIWNIEHGACGFCVTESFKCGFDDGNTFYCANPPKESFSLMLDYFKQIFAEEMEEAFGCDKKPLIEEKISVPAKNKEIDNSEYVMFDPNTTVCLYSNTLRLTIESSGKTVQIQKDVVEVGRGKECDFLLDGKKYVARRQATFFYEKHMWFLRDNFTTNGTWLNGVKMEPGKKYQLISNDEINFAMSEKVIFYKSIHDMQSEGEADAKAIAFLEAGMDTFAKSDHKDEVALKLIIAALSDAPLYFPVEIDLEAMFASADPTKLKAGDILQPSKDVKMRILTISPESGVEFVPMFTSNDEVNKGPSASIIRYYPQDYLPMLVQMDKPVIINPFSESRFLLSKQIITEILWPAVQRKIADNEIKQENDSTEKSVNDNLVGSKIGERYTILQLLGQGVFFKTYLVVDEKCNKHLAMKVCDKNQRGYSAVIRDTILQESRMMMKLNHPAVPRVFDIVEDEHRICIIREYIEGRTLDTVLLENGPIKEDTVLTWAQ